MKPANRPWLLFLVLLALAAAVVGYLEYLRRDATEALIRLEKRVTAESKKVNELRQREQRLEASRAQRAQVAFRLLDPAAGNAHGQILRALVRAARSAGAELGTLRISPSRPIGGVHATAVATTVQGTEAEVAAFIRLLEEGAPLTRVASLKWAIPINRQADPDQARGAVNIEVVVYGPLK